MNMKFVDVFELLCVNTETDSVVSKLIATGLSVIASM